MAGRTDEAATIANSRSDLAARKLDVEGLVTNSDKVLEVLVICMMHELHIQ